jgi:predicted deacetylase
MRRPDAAGALAVAVHDVSPATWGECRELVAMLDDAGARPLSLLVIPDYHHRAPVQSDRAFQAAMDARLAGGDELVLHGMYHVDAGPAPKTPRAFIERRLLTRAEGEFAALSIDEAALRLRDGIALFRSLGWPLHGFVPPAWLLGDAARTAVAQCGFPFSYVTSRRGIFHLPAWRFERTANLCYSPDTSARRMMSRLVIRHESRRAAHVPLLRISLHPQDARVSQVLHHWARLIGDALAQRTPVTKYQWVDSVRRQPAPAIGPVSAAHAARVSASAAPADSRF